MLLLATLEKKSDSNIIDKLQSKLNAIEEVVKVALRDVLDAKEYALKTKNETKYKELQARHLALGEVNQILKGDEKNE